MSARVIEALLPLLRHEPTSKRVRATLAGELIVDSAEAVLVWEPRRVVPVYAVPREHIHGELVPESDAAFPAQSPGYRFSEDLTVLDPSVPFAVHSTEGEPLTLRAAGETRSGAAFRPADPDLDGLALLDPAGLDGWLEEDDPVFGHARDPFHRIDILPSSRTVRIERDGVLLAESDRAQLLFEGAFLPVRCYLPPEDVRVALQPSATRTRCTYKGEASYWSVELDGPTGRDIAWTYEAPNEEAARIAGLVCFFNERVDLSLDGRPQPRPVTPWS